MRIVQVRAFLLSGKAGSSRRFVENRNRETPYVPVEDGGDRTPTNTLNTIFFGQTGVFQHDDQTDLTNRLEERPGACCLYWTACPIWCFLATKDLKGVAFAMAVCESPRRCRCAPAARPAAARGSRCALPAGPPRAPPQPFPAGSRRGGRAAPRGRGGRGACRPAGDGRPRA